MPSQEELVQFSANIGAEAKEAAAALAKLEAERERQQAELREVQPCSPHPLLMLLYIGIRVQASAMHMRSQAHVLSQQDKSASLANMTGASICQVSCVSLQMALL